MSVFLCFFNFLSSSFIVSIFMIYLKFVSNTFCASKLLYCMCVVRLQATISWSIDVRFTTQLTHDDLFFILLFFLLSLSLSHSSPLLLEKQKVIITIFFFLSMCHLFVVAVGFKPQKYIRTLEKCAFL